MNKIKIYVLLACLWAVSALQAQNFGSEAMRKLRVKNRKDLKKHMLQ